MGLFDWFSRKSAHPAGGAASSTVQGGPTSGFGSSRLTAHPGVMVRPPEDAGATDTDTGRKIRDAALQAKARSQERRDQRGAYRELLHQVVRESMVRAGLMSASYKFKVLSLDARGKNFLVMMDLPTEFAKQVDQLTDIERFILQTAQSRHQLEVSAVYWRVADLSDQPDKPASAGAALPMRPMPSATSAPAAAQPMAPVAPVAHVAAPGPAPVSPAAVADAAQRPTAPARVQPVLADEVAALKAALAAGAASAAVSNEASAKFGAVTAAMTAVKSETDKAQANKKLLLTGFEETEMTEEDNYPVLGATEYGDIR